MIKLEGKNFGFVGSLFNSLRGLINSLTEITAALLICTVSVPLPS